ncbi:MAG TPA: hypothetical protein VMB51_09540 [Solirubrobacteraceae bacterium]|nr:hypothetical protein [Solirubrobacteraceae bacterium]
MMVEQAGQQIVEPLPALDSHTCAGWRLKHEEPSPGGVVVEEAEQSDETGAHSLEPAIPIVCGRRYRAREASEALLIGCAPTILEGRENPVGFVLSDPSTRNL